MICVGYSKRASCDPNMGLLSLKKQNDRIREYARSKGWKLSSFYEDRSDSPDGDNGFQKLREAGLRREFDVVILLSVFRFGANVSFARELLLNAFYKAGIRFVVIEDDIDSSIMSYEELSDYFFCKRQKLNAAFKKYKERKEVLENNQLSGFNLCYGYKLSDDKTEFLIDEVAAFVIQKIFDMYDENYKTKEICECLNTSGFDAPAFRLYQVFPQKGFTGINKWSPAILSRLKRNNKYMGADVELQFRNAWYPQIISEEQFIRVNEKVKGNTRGMKVNSRTENVFGKIYYLNEENVLKFETCSDLKKYPYFHRRRDRNVIITYAELEDAVRKRLAEEKAKCEKIIQLIESGRSAELIADIDNEYSEAFMEYAEACEKYANERLGLYSNSELDDMDSEDYQSQECYSQAHRSQDDKILQAVDELTQKLKDMADLCEERKRNLSADNAWIKRYMKYTDDFHFTRKIAGELIDSITVLADGSIDVKLYCDEADAFPADWRCE